MLRIIDFVLYTSIFTACCATGLCMATERLVNSVSPPLVSTLHILVFGSVILVYNTPRIITKPYGVERKSNKNREWYLFFFFAGMALAAIGLYRMPAKIFIASGVLGIFAFAYFLPVLPFRNKKRLRDFGWLKITVLTGVWAISTSILPMLYWNKDVTSYPLEFLLRVVFIFTLCMVFDIRDMQADSRNNINTIPRKMGVKNTYHLINTSLLLFAFLSIVQYLRYPSMARLAGALLTAIVTKIVIMYLQKHPSDRAYSGLADGVMIIYALLVLIPK